MREAELNEKDAVHIKRSTSPRLKFIRDFGSFNMFVQWLTVVTWEI